MNIVISKKVQKDFDSILFYITENGYPDTAIKYLKRMKIFTESLVAFYEKYQLCKQPIFKNAGFRCALFEGIYIFVYKIETDIIKLVRVIHGKNLK